MKKHSLSATKRDLLGRKVKKLRKAGQIPATLYGKKVKSISVAVPAESFAKTFADAGETGLVSLVIEGEKVSAGLPAGRQVLVHTVQKDPVTGAILHIEFHQVDLKEKVHANIPLVLSGESPAITEKRGVLLTILDEIEVEALPTDLVDKIEVHVCGMNEVNQEVKIGDLTIPAGLTVLSDATLTVVKVGSLITKEAEAEAAAEAAAAAATAAEAAAGAEGAATPPAEGETPAEKPAQAGKKEEAKAEDLPAGSPRGEAGKAGKKEG